MRWMLQILLLVFVPGLVSCQSAPAAPVPAAAGERALLLWRVEAPGGGSAHLLGSIHFGPAPIEGLDPAIERAFAEAERLALELRLDARDQAAIARASAQAAPLPSGVTLKQVLGPALYQRTRETAARLGLPIGQFDGLAPWVLYTALAIQSFQDEGFAPNYGVDAYFLHRAEGRMPIDGLERAEEQVRVLSGATLEEQVWLLESTLDSLDERERPAERMWRAWRDGDEATLSSLVRESFGEDPRLARVERMLLQDRDARMADGVASRLEGGGRWFVVTGAAHMIGDSGIPTRLRARGYAVERVRPDPDAAPVSLREIVPPGTLQQALDAFSDAVVERDGAAAAALLSANSLEKIEELREHALFTPRAELQGLLLADQLQVLAFRALGAEALRTGTPAELFATMVDAGWVSGSDQRLRLGEPLVYEDVARVPLILLGRPQPFDARFVRERGAWRIDQPHSTRMLELSLPMLAQQNGMEVASLIAAAAEQTVGEVLWEPLLEREVEP